MSFFSKAEQSFLFLAIYKGLCDAKKRASADCLKKGKFEIQPIRQAFGQNRKNL